MQAKHLGPGQQVVIGGCGPQTPPPPVPRPSRPRNVALILEQCSRRWNHRRGWRDRTGPHHL